ncbi:MULTISPECIES: polysaccharide biosynthesis/export family protein [Streptomyces]|uniref:Polysaccharide biosynthesis/export family protein n=1 Tax=Streptomyces glycanivorans TaxID=3033808 RepID=A0ABY9J9F4_9ACTN|nr:MULTISPECIES: polysaccharide biosynthesis/export family protein [unclassified Streptomyces]TXS18798.1 hypothetical protein EAO68_14675 [Streptomyces sp. wa22]WLQ63014.1 polysaccharide biosynthesis/export family protein [Streptomyces sp. Alt3]
MSATALELGEIVQVEVRDAAGVVTGFSHDYAVDADRLLRIPSLNMILAEGKPLTPDLRAEIEDRFMTDGVLTTVTVNLGIRGDRVDLENTIRPGDELFVRMLNPDGTIDASSGSFPVDASGSINMPFLGGVLVRDNRFFEAEHQIEQGLLDARIFTRPLVDVTRVELF